MNYSSFLGTKTLHRLLILTTALLCCAKVPALNIESMRCEYLESPISIDCRSPRFTWKYTNDRKGFMQQRYRLLVASDKALLGKQANTGKGFAWASNIAESGKAFAEYTGPKLEPLKRYFWKVEVYDSHGKKYTSPAAWFETAMTDGSAWQAKWISDGNDKDYEPAPMLRKSFETGSKKILTARLYLSAAAYAHVTINGKEATGTMLNPGYTAYDKRNLYSVSDVTKLVRNGDNVIAAVLGNGFYNVIAPVATWKFEKARWRNRARMICQLRITYTDGTVQQVCSDGSWKTATGPWLSNNIYCGDVYDSNLEIPGWDLPGFDDSAWENAKTVDAPSSLLVAQNMPPIRVEEQMPATWMKAFGDTAYVFAFAHNMSGLCSLHIKGEKGTKVTLKHAELLKSDSSLQMRNIDIYHNYLPGFEFQTDTYILNGEEQTFNPLFSYHGFQYVEVKADRPITLTKESLTASFFHTDVKPVGGYTSANDMHRLLGEACLRSYLCNLMGIPTDCPQREKNGWEADAFISIDLGLMNFDGINFYEKWLDDFVDNINSEGRLSGIIPTDLWGYDDWIGPVWDAAAFIIPMTLYNYYGDQRAIEKMWPVCERYLEYLATRENDEHTVTYGIGDWVFYKTQTPTDYTSTCFYWLDNEYMARFARIIGKDGSRYAAKAEYLLSLINSKYLDREKALYANGSQAAQSVALYLGIVPAELKQAVADNLSRMIADNGNYLDCGMLGSKTILRVLTSNGHADQAYEISCKDKEPAWGNWIKRGYNTLPERWVLADDFRDSSLNHVFLGDIFAWMENAIAGINYDTSAPGFKKILVTPHFVKGLDYASGHYDSAAGTVKSSWKRQNGKITLNVTIPVNSTAKVVTNGKEFSIGAGEHTFSFPDNNYN